MEVVEHGKLNKFCEICLYVREGNNRMLQSKNKCFSYELVKTKVANCRQEDLSVQIQTIFPLWEKSSNHQVNQVLL
jgi:hypothetical protein